MLARMSYAGLDERGALTWAGEVRLVAQSMLVRWRRRAPPPVSAPVECPPLPEGATARAAMRWSLECSPPWLHAHVMRTWCWARLFGDAAGLRPDDELLFTASMLHDLGLTDRYAPEAGECFAVTGARHARRLLMAEGVPAEWAGRVADAIVLHLEVQVPLRRGVEAKLVHDATAFDVVGIGGRNITREARRAVLRAWSREGFGAPLAKKLRAVARDAPRSRMAFYCRRIDFAGRVERVRFPEEQAV